MGYWLGRPFWGGGIATRALDEFLRVVPHRPLHASAAASNHGSIRVLEKCGFTITRCEPVFGERWGAEVDLVLLELR